MESCLLLDRFVTLLSQLSGNHEVNPEKAVTELSQFFESGKVADLDRSRQDVYLRLSKDSTFMTKMTVLQIAK